MTYTVKEIYYTLQGEGAHTGRPAVFCRFSGCNLWSGYEKDREKAVCTFCDTDFIGTDGANGGKYKNPKFIAEIVTSLWPTRVSNKPYVVFTGGEPLLQLDDKLIQAFHSKGIQIGIETNGTIKPPKGIDWICVSPKANAKIVIQKGDELKLVYPQKKARPENFLDFDFKYFFLQPLYDKNIKKHTKAAVEYCLKNPRWRLSIQQHKQIGLP